jgi:hypothetical protein
VVPSDRLGRDSLLRELRAHVSESYFIVLTLLDHTV